MRIIQAQNPPGMHRRALVCHVSNNSHSCYNRFLVSVTSLRAGVDKDREHEQREVLIMTQEELEKHILELARIHAACHDETVKAELEKLRKQVSEIKERQRWSRA